MASKSQDVPNKLKKGKYIIVFEDPYTANKVEGRARLVRFWKRIDWEGEYWYVRFVNAKNIGEKQTYLRHVRTPFLL